MNEPKPLDERLIKASLKTTNIRREYPVKGVNWTQVGQATCLRIIKQNLIDECLAMVPQQVPVKEMWQVIASLNRSWDEDVLVVVECEIADRKQARLLGIDPTDDLHLPIVSGSAS